jgi:ribosome-associated protein
MAEHTIENSKNMVKIAIEAIENTKGLDIEIIDISEVSALGDFFIDASGTNRSQIQAMADKVEEALGRAGYEKKDIEGYESAFWILQDFGDIIVHIFDQENRIFYDLERIWRDGKRLSKEDL